MLWEMIICDETCGEEAILAARLAPLAAGRVGAGTEPAPKAPGESRERKGGSCAQRCVIMHRLRANYEV